MEGTQGVDSLFRILMPRTDHLREVDDHWFPVFPFDKNIELVKVTMNQAGMGEVEDEGHELGVEVGWVGYFLYLSPLHQLDAQY